MTTEEQFRHQLREKGYGEAQLRDYRPDTDNPMHAHDFSVMLLVVSGEFILARDSGATTFRPGEICELPAQTRHAERTGPSGARVLLAKK